MSADKWIVCPICEGEGKYVNPAIDSHGLTAEDFHEDPDFFDEYMAGTYDVTCNFCKGRTTVDAATVEQRLEERAEARQDRYRQMCEDGIYEPGWQDHRW